MDRNLTLIFFSFTKNNLIISITKTNGEVLSWITPMVAGFRSLECATWTATSVTSYFLAKRVLDMGINKLGIYFRGFSRHRGAALSGFFTGIEERYEGNLPKKTSEFALYKAIPIDFSFIGDVTGIPHNGCFKKAKKIRSPSKERRNRSSFFKKLTTRKFNITDPTGGAGTSGLSQGELEHKLLQAKVISSMEKDLIKALANEPSERFVEENSPFKENYL